MYVQNTSFHLYPLAQELNPFNSVIRDNIWEETPGDSKFSLGFAGDDEVLSHFSMPRLCLFSVTMAEWF